jgi:hypothetical protein
MYHNVDGINIGAAAGGGYLCARAEQTRGFLPWARRGVTATFARRRRPGSLNDFVSLAAYRVVEIQSRPVWLRAAPARTVRRMKEIDDALRASAA